MSAAWRFGSVDASAVFAVLSDPARLSLWLPGIRTDIAVTSRWPQRGSSIAAVSPQRGRPHIPAHRARPRQEELARVEYCEPPRKLELSLSSRRCRNLRLVIEVYERPGGCLVEVELMRRRLARWQAWRGVAIDRQCRALVDDLIRLAGCTDE